MKNFSLQFNLRRVKRFSRYLILIVATWLLFLWPNASPAYAEIWYNTSTSTDYYLAALAGDLSNCSTFSCKYAQLFNYGGATSPADVLYFYSPKTGDGSGFARTSTLRWKIYQYATTTNPEAGNLLFGSDDLIVSFAASQRKDLTATSTFDNGQLITGTNYWIVVEKVSDTKIGFSFLLNCPDFYGTFNAMEFKNGAWVQHSLPGSQRKYPIGLNLEAAPTNSIQIDFPEDTSSLPDFSGFSVSGYFLIDEPTIHLSWGTSSSTFSGHQLQTFDFSGPFDVGIIKWDALELNTTYYAQAWSLECPEEFYFEGCSPSVSPNDNGLYNVLASSTIISFYISGPNPTPLGYHFLPTSTSTSAEWVMTCDPESSFFEQSFCKLFQYLFSPKQSDFNQFETLKTALEHKPPMGYFSVFSQALKGFNASSSPAFTLTGLASLSSVIGPLDVGLAVIIFILFAFWVFNRIRKLEL